MMMILEPSKGFSQLDVQGHRGCRGLMPENTIPAFLKAVDLGVTTLELDVVITKDHQVLVSHDPFMSHEICLMPDGQKINKEEERSFNIYQMTAAEAQSYSVGELQHPGFPQQQLIKLNKPLLAEVIDTIENYIRLKNLKPVWYNIETKCTPEGDGIFHPSPELFSELLLDVVKSKKIESRVYIQSFDVRSLQYLKKKHAPVKLVLLVENLKGIKYNLKELGFDPDVYSPYYKLLNENSISHLHKSGIKVIPWTVNEIGAMNQLINSKVDGIITDYPNLLLEILHGK